VNSIHRQNNWRLSIWIWCFILFGFKSQCIMKPLWVCVILYIDSFMCLSSPKWTLHSIIFLLKLVTFHLIQSTFSLPWTVYTIILFPHQLLSPITVV
jgi:hypothetical protein